ncbi:MAG TPA: hypothetical protein VG345_16610 [Bryobacteraceae bacterium]|nr:hypothetical protein [Bryobacteraceae bacterium]
MRVFAIALVPWLVMLGCAGQARAQFLGYTSPQTVNLPAFDAVNAPATALFPNVGQSYHELCYQDTIATAVFQLRISASFDNVNYFALSDDATSQQSGCIYGQGSYPFVEAQLLNYSGGGTLSAFYTGTSGTSGPPTGSLNQSQTVKKILAVGATATAASYLINPPCGNSSGVVYFIYNSGNNVGGSLAVQTGTDSQHLSLADTGGLFTILDNSSVQIFPVPPGPATFLKVSFSVPAGANYTAQYIFSCNSPTFGYGANVAAGTLQPAPLQNSEVVSATNTSTGVTLSATLPQSAYLFSINAHCSAGTAQLTVTNGTSNLWSSGAAEVTTTTFKMQWNPGLASTLGGELVITLGSCGGGNTGTLDVQASFN